MSRKNRAAAALTQSPAGALEDLSRYVQAAQWALVTIQQIVEMADVLPGSADARLTLVVEKIKAELAKVPSAEDAP